MQHTTTPCKLVCEPNGLASSSLPMRSGSSIMLMIEISVLGWRSSCVSQLLASSIGCSDICSQQGRTRHARNTSEEWSGERWSGEARTGDVGECICVQHSSGKLLQSCSLSNDLREVKADDFFSPEKRDVGLPRHLGNLLIQKRQSIVKRKESLLSLVHVPPV